jgi:hypothetical protein
VLVVEEKYSYRILELSIQVDAIVHGIVGELIGRQIETTIALGLNALQI